MKLKIITLCFFVFLIAAANAGAMIQRFDKTAFYAVLKSGKTDDINEELSTIKSAALIEKDAYEGALLMRKAGLVKIPVEKLKLFKKGRIQLETSLLNNSNNGEYHFLRLIIQEHAPKIVKYDKELATDKEHIIKSFKNLSPVVQQAIIDYSKNSNILNPNDFNQ